MSRPECKTTMCDKSAETLHCKILFLRMQTMQTMATALH